TPRSPPRSSCRSRRLERRWRGRGGDWARHTSRFRRQRARATPEEGGEGHMQHLEEGIIHAWLDGALPAEESAGVERHVAVCTECASLVAEAVGMIAGASRIVSSLDIVPGGVI